MVKGDKMINSDKFKSDPLKFVLTLAYHHAMSPNEKGMKRHGDDKPFRDQISSVITRMVGIGYPLGQALKKEDESKRLKRVAAVAELLGAINYLAIAIINILDEKGA